MKHARAGLLAVCLVAVLAAAVACASDSAGPPPTSRSASAGTADATDAIDVVPWSARRDYEEWIPPSPTSSSGYVDPPARWTGVATTLAAPAAVEPGSRLEYVVTLTNDGQEPLDLTPCPGYRQELRGDDLNADPVRTATWRLSCESAPTLGPGEERRFAMRIDVPARTPGAELLLFWELVDAWDTGAQTWIALERTSATASPTTSPTEGQGVLPGPAHLTF